MPIIYAHYKTIKDLGNFATIDCNCLNKFNYDETIICAKIGLAHHMIDMDEKC